MIADNNDDPPKASALAPAINNQKKRKAPNRATWEDRFFEVQDYKKVHGHCRVPVSYDESLNSWVRTQRRGYLNYMAVLRADNERKLAARSSPDGIAPPELDEEFHRTEALRPMLDAARIVKLQMIGLEFVVQEQANLDAWETRYRELVEFKGEYGHTRVSRNDKDRPQLAEWVRHQRRYMTKKLKGQPGSEPLTDERIQRLHEVGFEWRLKPLVLDTANDNDDDGNDSDNKLSV